MFKRAQVFISFILLYYPVSPALIRINTLHSYVYIYLYVCMYVCMYVFVYICICVCMYVIWMYTLISCLLSSCQFVRASLNISALNLLMMAQEIYSFLLQLEFSMCNYTLCIVVMLICFMCSKNQDVSIKYVHKASFNVTGVIKNEIYQIRHVKLYLHYLS